MPRRTRFKDPKVQKNFEHLMDVAETKGVDASVEEFRRMFGPQGSSTEREPRGGPATTAPQASSTSSAKANPSNDPDPKNAA